MKRKFAMHRPSPAMLVALVALFVALGGTSYAAIKLPGNSVGSKQLKNGAVTNKKIGKGAVTASKINTSGLTVPNATNATNATNAGNATTLQGDAPSSFAPATIEAAHVVGASGQPAYQDSWAAAGAPSDEGVSFYKDSWGIVHIQGSAEHSGANGGTIFTLPSGDAPAKDLYLAVYGAGGTAAYVQITNTGEVNIFGPSQTFVGLTSVTFRAGL